VRFFGDLLPFEDALRTVLENVNPITRTEKLTIDDALGRVLARDLVATLNTPPFDRSSVDGYAVIATDASSAAVYSPVHLRLGEVVYAGAVSNQTLASGRCAQIATGARVPNGADAVVMAEDVRREGAELIVSKPVRAGDNIGRLGNDIMEGDVLLRAGTVLGAAHIGVLASQGICRTEVYMRPTVAILPTGEEIIPPGKPLSGNQIYDINSHTLAALVREHGGEANVLPIVGDHPEELEDALEKALETDLVLTSGGSSVGDRDLLLDLLEARGKVLFRGIKIKPSKPTTFSEIDGKPVLGIPGNPTSCLMSAYLFMIPALRRLAHLPGYTPRKASAKLAEKADGGGDRRQFLTVRIDDGLAYPVFKESSAITSMSEAMGYVVVPEATVLEKGAPVEVILF